MLGPVVKTHVCHVSTYSVHIATADPALVLHPMHANGRPAYRNNHADHIEGSSTPVWARDIICKMRGSTPFAPLWTEPYAGDVLRTYVVLRSKAIYA